MTSAKPGKADAQSEAGASPTAWLQQFLRDRPIFASVYALLVLGAVDGALFTNEAKAIAAFNVIALAILFGLAKTSTPQSLTESRLKKPSMRSYGNGDRSGANRDKRSVKPHVQGPQSCACVSPLLCTP